MSGTTWPEVLGSLIGRADLSSEQTAWAMGQILAGEASPAQIAGFAVALRAKGETIDEMEGLVEAMYAAATPLTVEGRVLDVVGTGGDRSFSVNISTMAAIVAAGAGVTVVKHGNRSASSKAGSADVLEQLGIRLDLPGRRRRPGRRRGRHHLLLRRRLPPGAAARRERAQRPRRRHQLQLPRPDRQPGQARRPGDRLRRPPDGAGDGRRVRPARRRRVGVPRRRRARRADHDHHLERVDGQRRRGRRAHPRPRRRSASRRGPPRGCAARTRRTTPRSCAGCSPARPGRCATPCCSTRVRRWPCTRPSPGSLEEQLAAGIARATEAVDSGAAAGRRSSAGSPRPR